MPHRWAHRKSTGCILEHSQLNDFEGMGVIECLIKTRRGVRLSDPALPLWSFAKTDTEHSGSWPVAPGCTMAY